MNAGVSPRASLAALVASVVAIATSLIPLVSHYADVAHVLGSTWAAVIVALGAVAIAAACVCAAGNSILQLFPPQVEHDIAAAVSIAGAIAGGVQPMTLIQDLGLAEIIVSDVVSFAGGTPINAAPTIGNEKLNVSAVLLPSGPTPDYQVFSGSIVQILGIALTDGAAIAAGGTLKIAEKFGNTWVGITASLAAVKAAT